MFKRRQSDRQFLRELIGGQREFMRELLLRMERSERQHTAAIQEMIADLRDHRGEWRAERDAWWSEWHADRAGREARWREWQAYQEEQRAEQRASREALFRMLDRLGPGDASA